LIDLSSPVAVLLQSLKLVLAMPSPRAPPARKIPSEGLDSKPTERGGMPPLENDGGRSMKKLFVISGAIFALIMSENLSRVAADEGQIPLSKLAGGYASTVQGPFAICLDPKTFLEESCTTAGALVIPFTGSDVGRVTFDKKGNACGTYGQVLSNLPVDASPPQVSTLNVTGKLLNYDPVSGTGDQSFTTYTGGQCNGATFDNTGATVNNTGTDHFVASGNGKRIDGIFTSVTDAVGGVGDFSVSIVDFKQ
jgi:hypothetical protein